VFVGGRAETGDVIHTTLLSAQVNNEYSRLTLIVTTEVSVEKSMFLPSTFEFDFWNEAFVWRKPCAPLRETAVSGGRRNRLVKIAAKEPRPPRAILLIGVYGKQFTDRSQF
jgi:hypothetical protein